MEGFSVGYVTEEQIPAVARSQKYAHRCNTRNLRQTSIKMRNSTLSPTEPVDSLDEPKEPGPSVENRPKGRWTFLNTRVPDILTHVHAEEPSNRENDKAWVVEKTNSTTLPANNRPGTFHRFGDLPPEIRAIIWQMAWPMRLVRAYVSKPLPQFHCRGQQPCHVCEACSWTPPVRAPTVMQACREARLETQSFSKPLSTWILLVEPIEFSIDYVERLEFLGGWAHRAKMVPVVTPFNTDTDLIFFESESILCLSKFTGPPSHNDVFQVALNPEMPLMLDGHLFDTWDTPLEAYVTLLNGIRALYHYYLRNRKHIYIGVGGVMTFVLTEEGWQKAVREGLFSGHYEEARIIPVDDKVLIEKYQDLRYHCLQHTERSRRRSLDRSNILFNGNPNVWHNWRQENYTDWDSVTYSRWISSRLSASRENLSDAQLLMLQIADFLMWDKGLGHGRGEEIMDLDGHLKKYHPLVQEHGFKLPEFTAVVSFQAIKVPTRNCSSSTGYHKSMPSFPKRIRHAGGCPCVVI